MSSVQSVPATERIEKIDFKKLGGPTYIGRPNGLAARKNLRIESLERDPAVHFLVLIPKETYNINSSFFLGLFGDSIRMAGSAESFLKKFEFVTEGREYLVISRSVERALSKEKILKV